MIREEGCDGVAASDVLVASGHEEAPPVAFITGAAGGLGSALARHLAADGFRLALVDVDAARLDAVADGLVASGVEVARLVVDLSAPGEPTRAVDRVLGEWGVVDLVLPFAGVLVDPSTPVTSEMETFVRDVNLVHPIRCAERAVAAAQAAGRRCTVVMPLSDAGLRFRDPWVYARAKTELQSEARGMVGKWRHDPLVHVVRAVIPPTRTEFAANSDAVLTARVGQAAFLDTAGYEALMESAAHPEEVAAAIVDAAAARRGWLYLEHPGAVTRWRARVRGEVLAPLLDRIPEPARRRLGLHCAEAAEGRR